MCKFAHISIGIKQQDFEIITEKTTLTLQNMQRYKELSKMSDTSAPNKYFNNN